MRIRVFGLLFLVASLAVSASVLAQGKAAADPLSGTWAGDWGPNAGDRNAVSVDLKWDGKALTGTVKSQGATPVQLQKSTFEPKTGTVHMEAEVKGRGGLIHYVIDGKVDKNMMSGSRTHDNRKGDFKLTKK
jgi:hypothetical protein